MFIGKKNVENLSKEDISNILTNVNLLNDSIGAESEVFKIALKFAIQLDGRWTDDGRTIDGRWTVDGRWTDGGRDVKRTMRDLYLTSNNYFQI